MHKQLKQLQNTSGANNQQFLNPVQTDSLDRTEGWIL